MLNETKILIKEALIDWLEVPSRKKFILLEKLDKIDDDKELIRYSQILVKKYNHVKKQTKNKAI